MKTPMISTLLAVAAGAAQAQQSPKQVATAPSPGPADRATFAAFKKRLTDGIDERIGKLEELEECIRRAPDMKAIKACSVRQASAAATRKNRCLPLFN